MTVFLLILAGLSAWVLIDSQRRYGQASAFSSLMGGLLPLTVGLTGLVYVVYRFFKKPGSDAPYLLKANFLVVFSALASLFTLWFLSYGGEQVEAERLAKEAAKKKQENSIAAAKTPYDRALIKKSFGRPYLEDLKRIPSNDPQYRAAQVELKKVALAEAQAQTARAEQKKRDEKQAIADARKKQLDALFSPWDGSLQGLTTYVKGSMNDPASYEHVSTVYFDQKDHLVVITKFRGKNAFNATVTHYVKAKVDLNGQVLKIIEAQ